MSASPSLSIRTCVAVVLALLLGSACIPLTQGRLYASKRVNGKQGADVLVSMDGLTCAVASETFQRVRVGESHRCVWTPIRLTPPPPRLPR
jgi:hypothetical protein